MNDIFTLQDCREIGSKAKDTRRSLNELFTYLSSKLPKTELLKRWRTVEESFGGLRSGLDDIAYEKFGDKAAGLFYGLDVKK